MAQKLLDRYKMGLGEVALVPSTGGAFEVLVDGATLYSKLEAGRFPDERAIIREMAGKI